MEQANTVSDTKKYQEIWNNLCSFKNVLLATAVLGILLLFYLMK